MRPLLILPFLIGCTNILAVDFEADSANQPPLQSPPSPADDTVQVFGGRGAALVRASSPINGAQSLVLEGPSSGNTPAAIFTAAPLIGSASPVHILWQMNDNGFVTIQATITAGNSDVLTLTFFENRVFANGTDIGAHGFGPFGVQVGLFPAMGAYTLSLTGDAATTNANTGGPLPNPAALPGSTLSLRIELQDAGPNAERLTIDEVFMTQRGR